MSQNNPDTRTHLLKILALSGEYCALMQNATGMEKNDLVNQLLDILPNLYRKFGITPKTGADDTFFSNEYLEENQYMEIKNSIASLLAEDDTYLETVAEDMKYSDTPIGASISEGLADIYQDLFNFVAEVRQSEGMTLEEAFDLCKENYNLYWSQTLCNILRPLNALRTDNESE